MNIEEFLQLKNLKRTKIEKTIKRILLLKDLKNIESVLKDIASLEQEQNKKTIFYLRIYTYMLIASENFRHKNISECKYNLKIARKFASDCEFRKERPYAKRIKKISDALIEHMVNIKNDAANKSEYHKLKIMFRTAQGICVLRILK